MASVREVSSIAEDLLCPICLSIFQEPRMLRCGHNFCLSCLESCTVPKGQHQGTCPECRDPFSLQDVTANRVLANLSEKARLLKLEESGATKSWYFCEEHEESLKLFCSQDEVPICVICRDLPQHQGHTFLPIRNAVKSYQDKLKASLELLENGVKWATNNQCRQEETMEELENYSQHLCGCIFIAFEELHEILNERAHSMIERVKEMKEDNRAEMERRLEHLKAYESSHTETISGIQAALKQTDNFAFLKGIKELMGQIQDRVSEEDEETSSGAVEHEEGTEEEEKRDGDKAGQKWDKDNGNGDAGDKDEAHGENIEEAEDGATVPVDPALGELEECLDFESWKELLRSISFGWYAPDLPYSSPPPEEEDPQYEGNNISEVAQEEEISVEEAAHNTDVRNVPPGESDKETSLPSSNSNTPPLVGTMPFKVPFMPCLPPFTKPAFQQLPIYNTVLLNHYNPNTVRGGPVHRWTPHLWRGRGVPRGSRTPRWTQGRGHAPSTPILQPGAANPFHQNNWRSPRKEPTETRKGQGGGHVNKQNPHSGKGSTPGKSEGDSAHKGAPFSGQGGTGQGQSSAKRPPTPHKGGAVTSGNKGTPNRHQGGHYRGRGRGQGAGSAKGSQKK